VSEKAIVVEGLSKRYNLGVINSGKLSEDLKTYLSKIRGKQVPQNLNQLESTRQKSFLALDDISFEINKGETVGIIGRNGAGKSTLLKILSRVTSPSQGIAKINGRMASLLEVGTGFHAELTGRENIFINGAILGMTRREIQARLDEIIEFSGVERHIDTPVKRYSSGMYVRLAFSVAAHLETEILVVDEVLAVGDAEFQKRCIGKMGDVTRDGRTVLFVSHSMASIQSLCSRTILLSHGKLIGANFGVEEGIKRYQQQLIKDIDDLPIAQRKDRTGNGLARFTNLQMLDKDGAVLGDLMTGQYVRFQVTLIAKRNLQNVTLSITVDSMNLEAKVALLSHLKNQYFKLVEGENVLECILPCFPITKGRYFLSLYCDIDREVVDWVKEARYLDVESGDYYNTGKTIEANREIVLIDHQWQGGEIQRLTIN
jgi:lipopolysaccharide transport system ATP-binding protein